MHKKKSFRFFALFFFIVILLPTCKKKELKSEAPQTVKDIPKIEEPSIQWYYFSNSDKFKIKKANSIFSIPKVKFIPWTEATRLVGVGLMYSPALLLINKAGILKINEIENEDKLISIPKFKSKTVSGFYRTDIGTLIKFYTNTVFSEQYDIGDNFCVYRYNSIDKKIKPLIAPSNFNLCDQAQLSSLYFNKSWFATFKTEINGKVKFNYAEFNSFKDILNKKFKVISQNRFIESNNAQSINNQKNIIDPKIKEISNKYENLKIEFFSDELRDKIILVKQDSRSTHNGIYENTAKAIKFNNSTSSNSLQAILFESGDLLYSIDSKEWRSEKLPELPKNFIYTYFFIDNCKIIAGWEEQKFFQIGRTGLLKMILP